MEDSTANGRSTAVTGLHSLLTCPTTQGQVPSGHWGHGRATRGPCGAPVCPYGPVGPTPTGHSRHGAMCPFGRYWSFGLLVLGGDREVTSLLSAASTEATTERKAERAQAGRLFCKIICGAGCTCCCLRPRHRRRQQHTEQPSRCISAPANSSRPFVVPSLRPATPITRRFDLQGTWRKIDELNGWSAPGAVVRAWR